MYCYVWSYVVRSESLEAFRIAYGADGEWVQLFRRDPEYIRTDFLRDRNDPARFMTIDFWPSREAWVSFRERFGDEFEALDKRFERLTVSESQIGEFDVLESQPGGRLGS